MADLRIECVSKHFGARAAVSGLNLDIASGEFVVLLGPSGAGKTTTLRLVAGLEQPDAGRVWIDGRDVTHTAPALRDVTFVFQQYSLYPHLNVYDNLAFPLRSPLRKLSEDEVKAKVLEVARLLRMEDKLNNPATQLNAERLAKLKRENAEATGAVTTPTATPATPRKALTPQDAAALAWAKANPNSPQAKQILERLGVK